MLWGLLEKNESFSKRKKKKNVMVIDNSMPKAGDISKAQPIFQSNNGLRRDWCRRQWSMIIPLTSPTKKEWREMKNFSTTQWHLYSVFWTLWHIHWTVHVDLVLWGWSQEVTLMKYHWSFRNISAVTDTVLERWSDNETTSIEFKIASGPEFDQSLHNYQPHLMSNM